MEGNCSLLKENDCEKILVIKELRIIEHIMNYYTIRTIGHYIFNYK